MKKIPRIGLVLLPLIFSLAACAVGAAPPTVTVPISPPSTATQTKDTDLLTEVISTDGMDLGLTYQRPDGNRVLAGQGNLPNSDPITLKLAGEITWLVSTPFQEGSLWTAALADGTIQSYLVQDGQIQSFDLGRSSLPARTPPMVFVQEGKAFLNTPPLEEASELTHPVSPNPETDRVVFISENGDIVLWEEGEVVSRLEVNALPDARILHDSSGRLLFLSDPTERYDHGVLGDGLEAGGIVLVKSYPVLEIEAKIEISPPAVIEGIAPIWSDLNGDGEKEILVTISRPAEGAQLVLYSESGQVLAEGPSAGQGYRWRHQLAVLPLGAGGETLIVDVLRPHLDATLEFFSWEGDRLVLQAELPGYSSHRIGSRNLDMALAGDLNGNGVPEIVVPGISQETLHGIEFQNGAAEEVWAISLGGRLTSNLAGVSLDNGRLSLGAGVGDQLLIWE